MSARSGTLFVVATPIGNLDDITHRAIEVLRSVACIYAEDTRHSRLLLQRYDISTRLISLHEHNESERTEQVLSLLAEGQRVALISDAGTPLVSDPGYRVVSSCIDAGATVSPVPGPSALLAALCVSGQTLDTFVFCGFPPAKAAARTEFFERLGAEPRTMVFFESRHRIVSTLETLAETFGADRSVTLARELTKRYESIHRNAITEHLNRLESGAESTKGEFVLVVAGSEVTRADSDDELIELKRVLEVLLKQLGARASADCAAEILGCRKNLAYRTALEMSGNAN